MAPSIKSKNNVVYGTSATAPTRMQPAHWRRCTPDTPCRRLRQPSKLEWIAEGLKDLRHVIQERKIRSIALPALDAGTGRLEWHDVRAEIQRILADLEEVDIRVYEPTQECENAVKRTVPLVLGESDSLRPAGEKPYKHRANHIRSVLACAACQSVNSLEPVGSFDSHFPFVAAARTYNRDPPVARLLTECTFDRGDNVGPAGWITCVLHFDHDCHDGSYCSESMASFGVGALASSSVVQGEKIRLRSSVFGIPKVA